jgi:flagellar biosynthetic protein FliR
MPQINVMLLAMPIKVLAAYGMLALTVRGWAPLFGQEFSHMANTLRVR